MKPEHSYISGFAILLKSCTVAAKMLTEAISMFTLVLGLDDDNSTTTGGSISAAA